ncbi:MAG: putative lipoprotein [Methylovulum sp.]|nr:MAG: putative lipoprotein [Methylovulum sp.]
MQNFRQNPARFFRYCSLLFLAGLFAGLQACSFSDSSKSISDSSSSVFSSPSSSSESDKAYKNEVADYTAAYLKSSSDVANYNAFLKGIGDIAAEKGISHWEDNQATYEGIGRGLQKAKVTGITFETYKKNFAGSNAEKMQYIQEGYDD